VALAFAINWPNAPIYIFPLPAPIKVKWLVGFLVVANLWMASAGADTGVAYMTHLGGLLFGFIYITSEERVMRRAKQVFYQQRSAHKSSPPRRRERKPEKELAVAGKPQKEAQQSERDKRSTAIDRVLDKISQSGLDSLTEEERLLLEEQSRKLRKH
jgi:hypothetical protein